MSLFNRLFKRDQNHEVRALSLTDVYGQDLGAFGQSNGANPDAVLSNLSTAARCVSLLSELLASSSLHVFRRGADGARDRADDISLYDVLHSVTNDQMSAFEARELMVRVLLLSGNHYSTIERGTDGAVTALYRLDPATVSVERLASKRLRYRAGGEVYLQDDILHIRGASRDGVIGQSPIAISRGMFGLALQQADTANKIAENAVRASGVFVFPGFVSPSAKEQVVASLKGFAGKGTRQGSVMIMDGGVKFEPFKFSAEDMEVLSSRRLSNEDVARVFGVPPTAAGITDKATYSNVEQEARALVQNALGPLASRIEAALMRCLLSAEERRSLYIEHDLSALLRGDVAARFEAYRVGREIGVFSANDVRRKENEPPIAGGNDYHMPVNWARLGDTTQAGSVV